jgi:hypothetical protein
MLINRTKSWLLALGLQLITASVALAQDGAPGFVPGLSDQQIEDINQTFDQPDLSSYGNGPYGDAMRAPSGWFGSFDAMFTFISAPKHTQIGLDGATRQVYANNGTNGYNTNYTNTTTGQPIPSPLVTPQYATDTNTADNSFINAAVHTGMRFEGGYMDDENRGWMLSGFYLNSGSQSMQAQNVHMIFTEPLVANYNGITGTGAATAANPNGTVSVGTVYLPILYGFVDQSGTSTTNGAPTNLPDGIPDDLNRNNIYGFAGRDRGVVSGNVLQTTTTLSGVPSREGGADTISTTGGTNLAGVAIPVTSGPAPGLPPSPSPAAGSGAPQLLGFGTTNVLNGSKQPIDYGDAVPLPLIFSNVVASDRTFASSIEADRLWRLGRDHLGGTWDIMAGPRLLNFSEQYDVAGTGGILANSYWNTNAVNRVVGAQFGVRYRRQINRLIFSMESRLCPAANFQSINQSGQIGTLLTEVLPTPLTTYQGVTVLVQQVNPAPATTSQLVFVTQQPNNPGSGTAAVRLNQPLNLMPTGFHSTYNPVTFAPFGELRANMGYQLFSSVSVNVGWTGIFASGIARSSDMVNYTLPNMGILQDGSHNKQFLIMNGVTLGLQWNR